MTRDELESAIQEGEDMLKQYPNNPLIVMELIQLRRRLIQLLELA